MQINGVKRVVSELDNKLNPEVECFFELTDLAIACSNADFVICVLPNTRETHDVFNKAIFEKFKKTAVFINIGRGVNVVESDLIKALKQGDFAFAGLDVFREEPLPQDSPFYTDEALKDKIFISCHKADQSDSLLNYVIETAKVNLECFLEGKPLMKVVDKEAGY